MARWNMGDRRRSATGLAIALSLSSGMVACQRERPPRFSVVVPRARRAAPVDGRVLLSALDRDERRAETPDARASTTDQRREEHQPDVSALRRRR